MEFQNSVSSFALDIYNDILVILIGPDHLRHAIRHDNVWA